MNNWLFKYRFEFPALICIITTIIYCFQPDIFLLFRPNLSLLFAVLIALTGFSVHAFFGNVSDKEDFQFNRSSISKHTKAIGDYLYWASLASLSGSLIVFVIYTAIYIFSYSILIKYSSNNTITIQLAVKRGINNLLLLSIAMLYISALKNFIITKEFIPTSWVIVLFLLSLTIFIVLLYISNKTTKA